MAKPTQVPSDRLVTWLIINYSLAKLQFSALYAYIAYAHIYHAASANR